MTNEVKYHGITSKTISLDAMPEMSWDAKYTKNLSVDALERAQNLKMPKKPEASNYSRKLEIRLSA